MKKTVKILYFSLLCIFFISCKKKETIQTGDVKVTVTFNAHTSGNYYYYVDNNGLTITLMNSSGSVVATQYSNGNGAAIDLGQYDYGNYSIKVTGPEKQLNNSNGAITVFSTLNQTQNFTLNSTTLTENFSF